MNETEVTMYLFRINFREVAFIMWIALLKILPAVKPKNIPNFGETITMFRRKHKVLV